MKNIILLLLAILIYSCSSGDDTPPGIITTVLENISESTSENTETTESADSETTVVKYTLTVTSDDGGSVSSNGGSYDEGTSLTITASPDEGYEFTGWAGSDETSSSLTLSLNSDTTITANFQKIASTENYYLKGKLIPDSSNGEWFDRSLTVNGLKLVVAGAVGGQLAVPDIWAFKVARLVTLLMDPLAPDIDKNSQENMIKTLKGDAGTWHEGFPTAQRVGYGGGDTYSPNPLKDEGISSYSGYQEFLNTNFANDMVWYKNVDSKFKGDDDINEVVEHIFHTIHLYGVPGGVDGSINALNSNTEAAGFTETELWKAMKEAIDNSVFGVSDYGNGDPTNPEFAGIMLKEYMYLLNYSMWEFGSTFWDGGSLAPEWNDNSRTPQGIETNNPLGFALFNKYFAPVLSKPSIETLRDIFKDNDQGESGYIPD